MFRIKNLRNSTVAKQTHILPSINNDLRPPAARPGQLNPEIKRQPRQPSRSRLRNNHQQNMKESKVMEHKLVTPKTEHKKVLVSKAHNEDLSHGRKLVGSGLHHKLLNGSVVKNNEDKSRCSRKNVEMKAEEVQVEQIKQEQNEEERQKKQQSPIITNKKVEAEQIEKDEDFMKFVRQQEQAKLKAEQESELQQQRRKQKQIEEQKKLEEKRQREERKKKEQQMQAVRQYEMQQMMQKVQARRKARQQQKERRRIRQQARRNQPALNQNQQGVAGLVALKDPLAHIQMSQAVMDRQIEHILKMKFTGYPNKQAIQSQVQQLDRINQSYMMVRQDPSNPLISGLNNFRIELFNRIGQMVMSVQGSVQQSVSGLQIVEADYLNRNIKDVKVTRGLEGHIQKLLKTKRLKNQQQCAICLGEMARGEQIYEVKCGHEFHKKCLEDWLSTTANCPACRYNIKMDHP